MESIPQGFSKFIHDTLYYFYIPVLLIWVFITTVRLTKSNLIAFLLVGSGLGGLIMAISTTSYETVFNVGVYALVPVFILLLISGVYHEQYKKKVESTDPVIEKLKAKIAKEIEQEKIQLHEKREQK